MDHQRLDGWPKLVVSYVTTTNGKSTKDMILHDTKHTKASMDYSENWGGPSTLQNWSYPAKKKTNSKMTPNDFGTTPLN